MILRGKILEHEAAAVVARAAAALGADVRAVALLGGASGRWIADELERIPLPFVASSCAGETRSCLSVLDREAGSLTEFYEESADVSPEEWEAFVRLAQSTAAPADWVTISGSLPSGAPADGYERLAGSADKVAVDTAALRDARPELVKVNAAEASALTGLAIGAIGAVIEAAYMLRRRIGGDGHAAAVTAGVNGAVLVTPDGTAWRGSLTATGQYPVGSGDAFLAGLVTALSAGDDWPDALAAALGAAVANADVPGAGSLDGERARSLAGEAVVAPAVAVKP